MQINPRTWNHQEMDHSTLDLLWNPGADCFSFAVNRPEEGALMKRTILSQTAQLFDPLGWLTPVIIQAKISIQSAWLLGLDWNNPLPEREAARWRKFQEEVPQLSKIKIPRAIARESLTSTEVHGFADASERAYAAMVYLKAGKENGQPIISIIMAKRKQPR